MRRKQRRFLRFLVRMLVTLLLVGGAAAAAWFVVIPYLERGAWAPEIEPIANEVAEVRDLQWRESVEVMALDPALYSSRLAAHALSLDSGALASMSGEWRAMGLVEGEVDIAALGSAATAARPAFFDSRADVVYEVTGLPEPLRTVALRRALAEALIAQQSGAPEQYTGSSASLASSLVGGADAATAVPTSDAGDPSVKAASEAQRATIPAGPARGFGVDMIVGDAGVTDLFVSAADEAARDALAVIRPPTDAALLDVGRPSTSLPAPVGSGIGEQRGMTYWYYVLASRLPSDEAWRAAAFWNGDEVVVEEAGGRLCVTASVATLDAGGRDVLFEALVRWSAAAPATASTTVGLEGDRIDVRSCDPGIGADTITTDSILPFGNAAPERRLVGSTDSATDASRRCMVRAVRDLGVVSVARSGDLAAVDTAMTEIRAACVGTP